MRSFIGIVLLVFWVPVFFFFFFNDTATTEIYTLSLHDALPISELRAEALRQRESFRDRQIQLGQSRSLQCVASYVAVSPVGDRKSTRLNSSHGYISYAVFCLKKQTEPLYTAHLILP